MQWLKLSYNTWTSGLIQSLNLMRENEEMCDVKILLRDGIVLVAHSNVLAAASPFFKSILSGNENSEVNMHDFPVEIINCILDFVYTGETLVKKSDILVLHSVAASLSITPLADMAHKMVQHHMPQATSVSKEQDSAKKIMLTPSSMPGSNHGIPPLIITPTLEPEQSPEVSPMKDFHEALDLKPVLLAQEKPEDEDESKTLNDAMESSDSFTTEQDLSLMETDMNHTGSPIDLGNSVNMDGTLEACGGDTGDTIAAVEDVPESEHSYAVGDAASSTQVSPPTIKKIPPRTIMTTRSKEKGLAQTDTEAPKSSSKNRKSAAMKKSSLSKKPVTLYSTPDKPTVSKVPLKAPGPSYTFEIFEQVTHDMDDTEGTEQSWQVSGNDSSEGGDDDGSIHIGTDVGCEAVDQTMDCVQYKEIKSSAAGCRDRLVSNDGYAYTFQRAGSYGTHWRCSHRDGDRNPCPATVKQIENLSFIRGPNAHNHGPAPNVLTIKSENGPNSKVDYTATSETLFVPYSVGTYVTKTYHIAHKASTRGRDLLIDSDGYKYTRRKSYANSEGGLWLCSVRSQTLNCPVTVSQRGNVYTSKGAHVHGPNSNKPPGWVRPVNYRKNKRRRLDDENDAEDIDLEAYKPAAPNQDTDGTIYTAVQDNGKDRLVATNGYTFRYKRIGAHCTLWRCNRKVNSEFCKAVVRQYDDMYVPGALPHIHDPDTNLIKMPKVEAPDDVSSQRQHPAQITDEEGRTYKIYAKGTQGGAATLIDNEGHRYTIKKRMGKRIQWKCAIRNKHCQCPAALSQVGKVIKRGQFSHKHLSTSNKPFGMENLPSKKKMGSRVVYKTKQDNDDDYKCEPWEDEQGYKYMRIPKASKAKTDKLICSDGFTYTVRREGVYGIQWKCSMRYPPHNCPGSARQAGLTFVRGVTDHNHSAEPNILSGSVINILDQSATMYESNGKTYSILHRASKAGKNILQDSDGHRYNFKSAYANTTIWRCSVRNKTVQCSAMVKQVGYTFQAGSKPHCHEPNSTRRVINQHETRMSTTFEVATGEEMEAMLPEVTVPGLLESEVAGESLVDMAGSNMVQMGGSDGNSVVELVLVGEGDGANYQFTTEDGITYQLPPGMVLQPE